MNASGLDVIVNPKTDLADLSQALSNYKQILLENLLGLSVTIDNGLDISSIIRHGIDGLVDNLFFVPSNLTKRNHKEFDMTIVNALPTDKLVIGLPSVRFDIPHLQDRSSIPSFTELCHGSNLKQWKPKIKVDDQVIWSHPDKSWKFSMEMGRAVTNQLSKIHQKSLRTGILLFDVPFRLKHNPVCLRYRTLFIDSLRQAARTLLGHETGGNRAKRDLEESFASASRPGMKVTSKGSRIDKILIFAVGDEDEQFRKYYSVDEDTILDSPVENVVLGYDDSGKVYDIYQQMPRELSLQSIFNTIHQYFVDKIFGGGGGNIFGAVQVHPPNILVYPDVFGKHPVPILVTWVRVASPVVRLLPRKTRKYSSTTTTSLPSTTQRVCTDVGTPLQRCFVPASLMEMFNLGSPQRLTTTTRKSATMRQTTAKPLIPLNPQARLDGLTNASILLTEEMTTPLPRSLLNLNILPLANSEDEPKQGSRMSYASEQHILCNWKSASSYLFCKTRK